MHKYQAILFDLDGTLLPMDTETFARAYFGALARELADFGIPQEALIGAIWGGTKAMMSNDGSRLNADVFWDTFTAATGVDRAAIEPRCDRFYTTGFHAARAATAPNALAAEAVRIAREKAEKVVLATNPLFPMEGQTTRLSWLGLSPADFDLVTCYSTDRFCKPNPTYFADVCRRIGVAPGQCLMIGNDEAEDMACARAAGMDAWLVTDCRIPCPGNPWQGPCGTFDELLTLLKSL
ncbi:MAG: HAD family hydrolase [Clostridia bacterium]|nr:HAD family hydrolase [Clostridia bacterium]